MRQNSPVYPTTLDNDTNQPITGYEGEIIAPGVTSLYSGLTIRELTAGLAMQGIIARGGVDADSVAEHAVAYADCLLAALITEDEDDNTSDSTERTDGIDTSGPDDTQQTGI